METVTGQLPWIVAGGSMLLALVMLVRPRREEEPRRHLVREQVELERLRTRVRDLEAQSHAHLDFIVNFPETVRSLTAALSVDQVLSACSRALTAMLMTRHIGIFLVRGSGLVLADGAAFPAEYRGRLELSLQNGLRPLIESRMVTEIRGVPAAEQILRRHGLAWDLAVPLWYGEQLLGLLVTGSAQGEPAMVRRVLAMLADITAVALHGAGQVSQIRDAAERDALTGLANRRTLMKRVEREVQRARSYGSWLSLAMVDVDHFKHYNDSRGHAAGDEALRQVARLLTENTRRTDLVGRYGGEEFTILLCGADRDQAAQHAERIRQAVAGHAFPGGEGQPLGLVSISVGLASFPVDATDVAGLFEAADRVLYRAKEGGRNRVVSVGDRG